MCVSRQPREVGSLTLGILPVSPERGATHCCVLGGTQERHQMSSALGCSFDLFGEN